MRTTVSERSRRLQRLQTHMRDTVSIEQLSASRAFPYGGAATSLAILLALTQVTTKDPSVKTAIVFAVIGLPLWLTLATIYEFYLYTGENSFAHYKSEFSSGIMKTLGNIAGLCLLVSFGGLVYFLLPCALWVFVAACFLAFYFLHRFNIHLANWWHQETAKTEESSGEG